MPEVSSVEMAARRFTIMGQILQRANTGQHSTYECGVNFFEPGPVTNADEVRAWIELCADILGLIIKLEDEA